MPQSKWLSFKQYKAISAATQRSFARGKEFGGWLLEDGSVEMWKPGTRRGMTPTPKPKNVLMSFHTHPNQGGKWNPDFSGSDIRYNISNRVSEYVISRRSIYQHIYTMGTATTNLGSNQLFNPYVYNPWWWKN